MSGAYLTTQTGLEGYDRAQWRDWLPNISHVHRAKSMSSLLQSTPHDAFGNNETDVPANGVFALLVWTRGVPSLDSAVGGPRQRRRVMPWSATLLPSGMESWWVSSPRTADGVFHLHFDYAFVNGIVDADSWHSGAGNLPPLHPFEDAAVASSARWGLELLNDSNPPSRLAWEAAAQTMVVQLLRFAWRRGEPQPPRGGLSGRRLQQSTDYMAEHLTDDISLAELSAVTGLSQHHFARAFKQSTGFAPHAWMTKKRVERAEELMLAHSAMGLAEVAVACGFSDQAHFTKTFVRLRSVSPGRWRRERMG